MAGYMGNDGNMYYFEDLNNCGDHYYWMTSEGTLFDADELMEKAKAITPSPTVTYSDFYAERYVTADSVLQAAQDQWLWIIGNPYITGLACYYDNAHDRLVLCRYGYDDQFYMKNIPNEMFINHGIKFYICYREYFGGVDQGNFCNIISSNAEGKFNITYQIVNPENITQILYINRNVPRLPVGETMPLITLQPDTVCAYSGTTDGSGISITIGGITYGVFKQAWITASYVIRYRRIPFLEDNEVIPKDNSNPSDPSTEGGGDGSVQASIDIPIPDLPPDMLLSSGVIKMYSPSANELNAFMHYIYSAPDNIIANFKKIWSNPMQSIISFSIVPLTLTTDGSETVKFCGVDSGVSMGKVKSQFIQVDCGSLKDINGNKKVMQENNGFLDYTPFTKVHLYAPFCGIFPLNPDDVMNAELTCKYNIDLLTGDCICFINSDKQDDDHNIHYNSYLYAFKGNILAQSPLAGNDYQQLYNGILNVAGMAAGMVVPIGGAVKAGNAAAVASQAIGGAKEAGGELLSQKVSVQRSGAIVGNTGQLGGYKPFIIVERPISSIPAGRQRLVGDIDNVYHGLNALKNTGFTIMEKDSVKVDKIKCTDRERDMIKQYLESGVIF